MYRKAGKGNQSNIELVKLRGKYQNLEFKKEFGKARTSWIMFTELMQPERKGTWNELEKPNKRKRTYEYDSLIDYNGRLVQKILVEPKIGVKYSGVAQMYYVDLQNYAIIRIEAVKGGYFQEYKMFEGKWYFYTYYKVPTYFAKENGDLEWRIVVTEIKKGKNDVTNPMKYRIVQEVKHRISDWNDSFWENYNYIKLEDSWSEEVPK